MDVTKTAASVTYLAETRREKERSQPGLPLVTTVGQPGLVDVSVYGAQKNGKVLDELFPVPC